MILIALGSNIGDRARMLARAREALMAAGIDVVAASAIHETEALLPENAPSAWNMAFLNQVVQVATDLHPVALLDTLKSIEAALGRPAGPHWGPRVIDLDLIAYHDEIIDLPQLRVPHMHLHTRRFVLEPLVELAPDWLHPTHRKTAQQLLDELR